MQLSSFSYCFCRYCLHLFPVIIVYLPNILHCSLYLTPCGSFNVVADRDQYQHFVSDSGNIHKWQVAKMSYFVLCKPLNTVSLFNWINVFAVLIRRGGPGRGNRLFFDWVSTLEYSENTHEDGRVPQAACRQTEPEPVCPQPAGRPNWMFLLTKEWATMRSCWYATKAKMDWCPCAGHPVLFWLTENLCQGNVFTEGGDNDLPYKQKVSSSCMGSYPYSGICFMSLGWSLRNNRNNTGDQSLVTVTVVLNISNHIYPNI